MGTVEAAVDLKSEKEGTVLTLTLNRPESLNALTPDLLTALAKALRDAEKDAATRCVVLTGAGRAFTAGADLAALKERGRDRPLSFGEDLRERFNPVILQIRKMEKPVLAAVNGVAAGAGASLAFACDLKVAAEDAKFHLAFIKVGLVPDSGMSWFLPRTLGLSKALEAAWTGEPITAQAALEGGLVNRLTPAGKALEEAKTLASKLAELPPKAVALTKRAVNHAFTCGLEAQLEYESHLQELLGRTADHQEGVAAFLEKRPPKFTGK